MALTSNYTKINTEGWTETEIDNLSRFCFKMLTIGMNEITKDNLEEVWFRFNFLQRIGHSIFREPIDNVDFYNTLKSYIGYECNVSKKPRYKFIRRWAKTVEHEVPAGCLIQRKGVSI